MVITMEGYYSMKMHVFVRFGRWQEIIDEPTPTEVDLYPVTIAMHHYAKTVAYAFLKDISQAEQHFFIRRLQALTLNVNFLTTRLLIFWL